MTSTELNRALQRWQLLSEVGRLRPSVAAVPVTGGLVVQGSARVALPSTRATSGLSAGERRLVVAQCDAVQ